MATTISNAFGALRRGKQIDRNVWWLTACTAAATAIGDTGGMRFERPVSGGPPAVATTPEDFPKLKDRSGIMEILCG
jgi:hypothetical protein